MVARRAGASRKEESTRPMAHKISIQRAPGRSQQSEVTDGLEEVRFPMAVLPQHDHTLSRNVRVCGLNIAEVSRSQPIQFGSRVLDFRLFARSNNFRHRIHFPVKFALRFSRNAAIPSRISPVAESIPK